jgi:hypothetical protein
MEAVMKKQLQTAFIAAALLMALFLPRTEAGAKGLSYPIVDTGQVRTYSDSSEISPPAPGEAFFGQDGQYQGNAPNLRDNRDGTISDLVTGLMWQKTPGPKVSWQQAMDEAASCRLGGHSDWRLPSIKELYSLIDFRGNSGTPARPGSAANPRIPYINTDYFDFEYGDPNKGERYIDSQYWSSTRYVSTTMHGFPSAFGVNFADGRIKGYPIKSGGRRMRRPERGRFVIYVRGNPNYGQNRFVDNKDGTISDLATGLVWMKQDSRRAMNWAQALEYAEGLKYAGHSGWRLPNAKELQSLVDYTRAPDATGSAAISPLFEATPITNEAGQRDYGFYWTSTTHKDGPNPCRDAVYIAFGRALGQMHGRIMDVHGAGAQRGDPKAGGARIGRGPQGDARRGSNLVRCVRGGRASLLKAAAREDESKYPHNVDYPLITRPMAPGGRGNSGPPSTMQGANPWAQPGQGGPGMGQGGMGWRQGGMGLGPGSRQGPQPVGRGGHFIQRLDRDGDGRVSRSEFDGPPRHFNLFDRNRDGYLSAEEAPPPPPGMGPIRHD